MGGFLRRLDAASDPRLIAYEPHSYLISSFRICPRQRLQLHEGDNGGPHARWSGQSYGLRHTQALHWRPPKAKLALAHA